MRLALITETFPPQINGVSRTLGKLAEFMTSHGHELLVIHPEYRDLDKKNDFKINVHDKLKIVSLKAWPLPFYPEIMLPRPPFTTMKKALVEFQPDLVHIATAGGRAGLLFPAFIPILMPMPATTACPGW
jgi:glycosyltransferase involved in cell wall biosynthesis